MDENDPNYDQKTIEIDEMTEAIEPYYNKLIYLHTINTAVVLVIATFFLFTYVI